MKYKDYSPEIWKQIQKSIQQAKAVDSNPIAAFDADGTLWDTDLGEAFFQFQIDNQLVPLPENPWDYYNTLKKKNNDPREAYLWLAQINKGVSLAELKIWSQEALKKNHPTPIFPAQKKLIDLLQENGITVYIVTASIKWAVEPGAYLLGLDSKNVIGIETQIIDGKISELPSGAITYKEGKVEALHQISNQKNPFLAVGNTMGDLPLIASATHLHLAVSAVVDKNHKLYSTENELLNICQQKQWLTHRFI